MVIYPDNAYVYVHEALKQKRGQRVIKDNYDQVANSTINVGYLDGKKIKRAIFYLRSKGCEWSCKTNGGCFMCGHYFGTSKGRELPKASFIRQFVTEYNKYDFTDIPMICIYNAGSILNNQEINTNELLEILSLVNQNEHISRIILESRPEFIDYDILEKISELCPTKTIEIGIGLETTNNYIRSKCINKGFSFQSYIEAVNKIKQFDNLKVLTYISVKPLFLTIEESIDDVVSSVQTIAEHTDIISFEPVSIQKDTLVEYLYEKKLYNRPKGWIIQDIMMQLSDLRLLDQFELRIGGFEFFPIPYLVIDNCPDCNKALYEAIDYYNSTKRLDKLQNLTCNCRACYDKEKEDEMNAAALSERISDIMNRLLIDIID